MKIQFPIRLAVVLASFARAESIPDPPWLQEKLEAVRVKHNLPALAAAVVFRDRIIAASAVGVRRLGATIPVTPDDRFHLGSIAKPMTATLVALCVQSGEIRWQTTVTEMFPELSGSMQPAYQGVTVAQLLAHRSGMPYERMMRERAFTPLGMTTAAFGNMASVETTDGPWEHDWKDGRFIAIAQRSTQSEQARAPVGRNVVCSVIDLARFAQLHLDGAHGRSRFLCSFAAKTALENSSWFN